jgi:D-lyxose ketol-isomerase
MAEDGQRAPHHFHVVKTEDIVNRGGARFVVELFTVDAHGAPVKDRFRALKDVSVLDLKPGDQVRLEPGESLTLEPFIAHAFWAEAGAALAAEVSLANDDATDNYFVPPLDIPADRRKCAGALRDGQGSRGRAAPSRRSKHCRVQ